MTKATSTQVLVVGGSPKAQRSITLQYVRFLEQSFPEVSFSYVHAVRELRSLARRARGVAQSTGAAADPAAESAAAAAEPADGAAALQLLDRMAAADLVVWATPVYYFLVPSQLMALLSSLRRALAEKERAAGGATDGPHRGVSPLRDTYATAITTSIHFFDHTAHDYLWAESEDLGLRVLRGLSAGMNDLLGAGFRESLRRWFAELLGQVQAGVPTARRFRALPPAAGPAAKWGEASLLERMAALPEPAGAPPRQASGPTRPKRVVLLSDAEPADDRLRAMEAVLAARISATLDRIPIGSLGMRGGCLGCLRCGWQGHCTYRDGFEQRFREQVLPADGIVFSGAARGRFLSPRFKQLLDRMFFLGHRPELAGKPVLWIVSGPLRDLHTLREVLESFTGVARAHLVDILSDEVDALVGGGAGAGDLAASPEGAVGDAAGDGLTWLAAHIAEAAARLDRRLDAPLRLPRLFPAVAGSRIFRDFVFLTRGVFAEDHRYYQRAGHYDFPQRAWRRRAADLALYLGMHLPPVRKRAQKEMVDFMLRPFEKIVGPPGK